MTLILGILTFFVILAVLILVHEFGHFSFAKLNGVRVEEFGLGFPPRIKAWYRGGTAYTINAIPIGGFVRMVGENGEDADPDSFGAKPPWRRLTILAAGPCMNILLALTILFFALLVGSPRSLTVVTGVSPGSPAAAAGLRNGDRIVKIEGQSVKYLEDLQAATLAHTGQRVSLVVQRGDHTFGTTLIPRKHPPRKQGPMGVLLEKTQIVAYSPDQAARLSVQTVGSMITGLPVLLRGLSEHGTSGVAGPVGIANITTHVVQHEPQQGPGSLLQFVALLSANLGVLNLLPIPALDGGRIVFVLISWIRRRNLDPEVEGLIHMVGMAALLFLIAVVSYQDLVRWITGASF